MKNLRFVKLELLSTKESKAREIKFHPRLTVIKGANDVGKSSVIKSIYWSFGANPKSIHRTWHDANVRSLLTFTIDELRYSIMRSGNNFAIFNDKDDLILSTSSVTRGLAPFMAELLDFRLVLASRRNIPEVPPPAFAFLPFYINQESSWEKPLTGFDDLGQYPNFRDALIDFHSGILGNDYYTLEAEKKKLKFILEELARDRRVMTRAFEKSGLHTSFSGLEFSFDAHEAAIERVLRYIRELKERRQDRVARLVEIVDSRSSLENQIKIAKYAMSEIENDAQYAATLSAKVYCPICNTPHVNDFANRYKILDDREACLCFIQSTNESIRKMTDEVRNIEIEIRDTDQIIAQIQENIAERQGEISLGQIIKSEAQRTATELIQTQISDIDAETGALRNRREDITDQQKELKSPTRRDEIEIFYAKLVTSYLRGLDVLNYDAAALTKINARIIESGSDQPRAVLAYNLAFLHTIYRYGKSFTAPMVIDSPNQQDQDKVNVAAMIKLVTETIPENGQVILGSVELHGIIPEDASIIEFTEKLSVLRASEFNSISTRMEAFIQKIINS